MLFRSDMLELRRQVLEGRLQFARAVTEQHQLLAELIYYYGVELRPVAVAHAPAAAASAATPTTAAPRHH